MMAVFIPTTSPRMFTSGPPELPRLMTASVWMKSSMARGTSPPRLRMLMLRPLALTIPAVMVEGRTVLPPGLSKPGLPMARTHSPTLRSPLFPSGTDPSSSASTLRRATSVWGSRPTSSTSSNCRRSASWTVTFSAPCTTWLFVTM